MCITSGHAYLSGTKIVSFQVKKDQNLLAYSNTVENESGGVNSMILPIPGAVEEKDFFDTTPYAKFVEELEDAWNPKQLSGDMMGLSKGVSRSIVQEFKVGMYDVLVSKDVDALEFVLAKRPMDKRPQISSDLLRFYQRYYPDWSLVVCIFDNVRKMKSQPIMFTYKPIFEDFLFFPAVDGHDGLAPKMLNRVQVDHSLFAGDTKGIAIKFKASVPTILEDRKLIGKKFNGYLMNGDWWYPTITKGNAFTEENFHRSVNPPII